MNKPKQENLFSLMDDRKNFLNVGVKYISKINNAKRLIKEKKEKNCKKLFTNKIHCIIYMILCIIIIILLCIIFLGKNKDIYSVYPEAEDFLYVNTSELDEPKSLFILKEDHTEIKDKNKIRICYCIDGGLIYPTLVSMTSALENNDKEKNVIIFYLFVSHNFNKKKVEIFDFIYSFHIILIKEMLKYLIH